MKNIYLTILFLYSLIATAAAQDHPIDKSRPPQDAGEQVWGGIALVGSRFKLQSDTEIRFFHFLKDGYVAVSAGEKGGAVIAPTCYWKINRKWLQVFETDGHLWFQMRLLNKESNHIKVDNGSGAIEAYEIRLDGQEF